MLLSGRLTHIAMLFGVVIGTTVAALAADPGTPIPATSAISDQKAGSVLFYNKYISNASNPATENTRINITNTSPTARAFVHFFFVDGASCAPADNLLCLTPNQTASFLASDIDPGVQGYIIAIAVDGTSGLPAPFNFLVGDAYFKEASQHAANLGAVAAALVGAGPTTNADGYTATLNFDDAQYNALPRVLAADSIPSQVNHVTNLIVYSPASDLINGGTGAGRVFGILYDDTESAFSFGFSLKCHLEAPLLALLRTTPRINVLIPQGRTGWLKLWEVGGAPLLGAVITRGESFGGHNLHALTFTTATITVPVFPPSC